MKIGDQWPAVPEDYGVRILEMLRSQFHIIVETEELVYFRHGACTYSLSDNGGEINVDLVNGESGSIPYIVSGHLWVREPADVIADVLAFCRAYRCRGATGRRRQ